MNPFVLIGAAAAALVTGIAIMIKGRIVTADQLAHARGGSADSRDVPTLSGGGGSSEGDGGFALNIEGATARAGGETGPSPTQTQTGVMDNGGLGYNSAASEPSVSFASAGDAPRRSVAPQRSSTGTLTQSAPGTHGSSTGLAPSTTHGTPAPPRTSVPFPTVTPAPSGGKVQV